MCLEVPSLLYPKPLHFGFATDGTGWELRCPPDQGTYPKPLGAGLLNAVLPLPTGRRAAGQQQWVFGGSAAKLQLCTATLGHITAVANIEAAEAGCPGRGWKHEQSKGLGMEEEKWSTCQEAGKEITFGGKTKAKTNHYLAVSVRNIFGIPSPILCFEKGKSIFQLIFHHQMKKTPHICPLLHPRLCTPSHVLVPAGDRGRGTAGWGR